MLSVMTGCRESEVSLMMIYRARLYGMTEKSGYLQRPSSNKAGYLPCQSAEEGHLQS